MNKLLLRCARSLFTRLALIMVAAAVVVNIVSYHLFFFYQSGNDSAMNRSLLQYARFLTQSLGTPPSRETADALGQRLGMRIRLEGPESWVAGLQSEEFPESSLRTWELSDSVRAGRMHNYHWLQVRVAPNLRLTFETFPTPAERAESRRLGLLFLASTCLVFLLVYGVMRYMLRPVRWLTEGAAAVRDGDLRHRVPEKRGGELQELVHSFNQMVSRLEGLVQGQQRLLLDVNHELRTPLTRLKLRIDLLPESKAVDGMKEDIREMEKMVSSLLDAARMRHDAGTLERSMTDLPELLEEIAARYAARAPGITVFLPETPAAAWLDQERIKTLLGNLLDNALKYSAPEAQPVELHLQVKHGLATILVRDYGVGISAEDVANLFEPFYRVDASRTRDTGGYGLGLSLSQAIVSAHGGEIEIESKPGQGTTVRVSLPGAAIVRQHHGKYTRQDA